MFKGRNLLIATKHEKEKVIAPILDKELGVNCFVVTNLDTDEFGTFTTVIFVTHKKKNAYNRYNKSKRSASKK